MGALMTGLAIAGVGMQAVGQIQQGYAANAAAKANANLAEMQGRESNIAAQYNAAVSRANAEAIRASSEVDIQKQIKAKGQLKGSQVAGYGASGVKLEGSPMDVLIDSAAQAELDIAITKYNAKTSATQAEYQAQEFERQGSAAVSLANTQAAQERRMGKYYINQGWMSGTGTLLSTAADFYKPKGK
jgi:hypothetical protein